MNVLDVFTGPSDVSKNLVVPNCMRLPSASPRAAVTRARALRAV